MPPIPTATCRRTRRPRCAEARAKLAFSLAPHAPYTVGDATFERIVMYARQLDLPIQTHIAETAHEVRKAVPATVSRRWRGCTGSAPPGLVHRHPRRPLRRRRSRSARHARRTRRPLPRVEHEARERRRAGRRVAGARIDVALGTDGAASNNRLDLFGEMRLATLLAKVDHRRSFGAARHGDAALRDAGRRARAGPGSAAGVARRRARKPTSSRSTSAGWTRRPATIRCRISSTSAAATR